MKIAEIDFPAQLLTSIRDNECVVFAGAGVSMGEPAGLPNFSGLADGIAEHTGESRDEREPEDRFLGRLSAQGIEVHARASQFLEQIRNEDGEPPKPTPLHCDLLRLYRLPQLVRIATTNFDVLFQDAANDFFDPPPSVFTAPAVPLGRDFQGIVQLHGSVRDPRNTVLTDADFGRAYLTDGWARRFLVQLFHSYSVLFVGYSHQDAVMHYLSSALPAADSRPRFALVKDDETEIKRWKHLGIQAIPYLHSGQQGYEALDKGIGALADFATLGVLDWRDRIKKLAEKPPPDDEHPTALIDDAMQDVTNTQFFTRVATDPQWINWLDQRGHFASLFRNEDLSRQEVELANWLANTFARENSHDLLSLIARRGSRVHHHFWFALCRIIGTRTDPPLPQTVLSQWASFLVTAAHPPFDAHSLKNLANRCSEQDLVDHVVEIFDAMTAPRMSARPGDYRLALVADDDHSVSKLWEEAIAPRLDQLAEPLLARITPRLITRHRIRHARQKNDPDYDFESFARHAIEPHEQDNMRASANVLIDGARDCLEHLATGHSSAAADWCDRYAQSETPLLRRLALHTLSFRKNLNAGQKCEWLLHNVPIHDRDTHHEVFRVAKEIYSELGSNHRQRLVDAILEYRNPGGDDAKRRTAFHHFDWLHWLLRSDPDCDLISQHIDRIQERYPEFQPSENPDLTHSIRMSVRADTRSPWTVEQLLSKPPLDWLADLLSYQPPDIHAPGRGGLCVGVRSAAAQAFQWSLELADALIGAEHWQSDLWAALLQAWSAPNLDDGQRLLVLRKLVPPDLRDTQIQAISAFLVESHKAVPPEVVADSLEAADELASDLWDRLQRNDPGYNESHDWLTRALNHPAGYLAQFWLHRIALWRQQQPELPSALNEHLTSALSKIVENPTASGTLGRCMLCNHLDFLIDVDETWAERHLLPLLDIERGHPDSIAAWCGFLAAGTLPNTEAVQRAFLNATHRLQLDLRQEGLNERFVEAYTHMIFTCVDDPLPEWIPALFRHADAELRPTISWHIRDTLRHLDSPALLDHWRRWLKTYWSNRLQGVPAPLCEKEIGTMLSCLSHLHPVYPEALDIAVQLPPARMTSVFVLNDVMDNNLHHANPEPVARLLDYLSLCEVSHTVWTDATVLFDDLLKSDIPDELKIRLQEIVAEYALD